MSERTRSKAGGRPGSIDEARELVALISSLAEAGDALDVEAVAGRLGISRERAKKLLSLVLTARTTAGIGLPLVEDGGMLALVSAGGTRGRALRLTRTETVALVSALERIGVAPNDPLRARLESTLSAEPIDEALVCRLVDARENDMTSANLVACAQALAERRGLSFSYRRLDTNEQTNRNVQPLGLRLEESAWLLDGFDLDRAGNRTFRVDRMADVSLRTLAHKGTDEKDRELPSRARTVRLCFSDPSYLNLLPWHDLHIESTDPGGVVHAQTPWYGSSWLVRMVAACGGTCSTDDPELTTRVRSYVAETLG